MSGNLVFPQSMHNIKIGEKYTGPKDVETTIGGYSGTLTIGTLKNGTVHSFHFISRNVLNSRAEIPQFLSGADSFLNSVSMDFKIIPDRKYWKHRKFADGNLYDVATCSNDTISYLISFSYDVFENFSAILFTVTHKELSKRGADEHLINDRM